MPRTVDHLGVPPMDLTITEAGNGKLKVELQVPRSSGSLDNIPFLEVTRNEQQTLLNGARQDVISRLSQSGFQIGEVKWEAGGGRNDHAGVGANGSVPKLGKVSFEITADSNYNANVSGSLRNNPDVAGAIRDAERNFDTRRQDIYESRAREWNRQGGATLTSNGETYTVTQDAAKTYVNERHPLNPFKRVSADDLDGVQVARVGGGLVPGNEQVNRQFEQALKGANGDRDLAALAVQTISQTPGYKPDAEIRVVQGNNGGMIVSQGEGPTSVNAAVPQAKQGDFERVAVQMSQNQNTQVAAQPDQPERVTSRTM